MTARATTPWPSVSAADYNPLLPGVRADPYPYYAALRRESPVHPIAGLPFYAVSRYDDVCFVLHHPELFSSTAMQTLLRGGVGIGPNAGALEGHRLLDSPMMLAVDPPDHSRLRRLVNRGFTPRRIAALEPRLRELAAQLVERALPGGRMELVSELAIPFPVTVIAELLGVEPARREQFKHWSDTIVLGLSGVASGFTPEDIRRAADEMADYLERVADERRAAPRDDLISILVQAEEGEALDTGEVLSFIVLLLVAGNETTTNLIGNATKALLEEPQALAEVAGNASLVSGMIEEALRYESPIQWIPRQAARELELAGTPIPQGAFVMALFASANRDEKHFPDPDRFDLRRDPVGHLAFGHGIHFCLGAALARLEARVVFETLFARCADLRLEADEVPMLDSVLLRGPKSLPLAFTRR
jgi:cytochrome P450